MSEEIDYKSAYESVLILKDMLIKENQQLKEQLEKKYETTGTLTNEILYEETQKLQQENRQLKEMQCTYLGTGCKRRLHQLENVLDEIREKIDFYIHYSTSDSTYMSYQQYKELLQILDKVKE